MYVLNSYYNGECREERFEKSADAKKKAEELLKSKGMYIYILNEDKGTLVWENSSES